MILCTQFGRDPKTVWHSLVCFPPLTPWDSVGYFGETIEHYNEIGIYAAWRIQCTRNDLTAATVTPATSAKRP